VLKTKGCRNVPAGFAMYVVSLVPVNVTNIEFNYVCVCVGWGNASCVRASVNAV